MRSGLVRVGQWPAPHGRGAISPSFMMMRYQIARHLPDTVVGSDKGRNNGRQSALPTYQKIIDALSDHIAILDERAEIIAVNISWQRFAERNALRSPDCGLGT